MKNKQLTAKGKSENFFSDLVEENEDDDEISDSSEENESESESSNDESD